MSYMQGGFNFGNTADWGRLGLEYYQWNQDRDDQQKNWENMKDWQKELILQTPYWQAAAAEKAGVHPLAVMGNPVINAPLQRVGDTNRSLSRMGQTLSNIGRNYEQRRLQKVIVDQEKAKLTNYRLQNRQLQKDLNKKPDLPGQPNGIVEEDIIPSLRGTDIQSTVQPYQKDGTQIADQPKYQYVRSGNGYFELMMSDNYKQLAEDTPESWVFAISKYWKKGKRYLGHRFGRFSNDAKKDRIELRKIRSKVPTRPGYRAVWDRNKAQWKEVPQNSKHGFYLGLERPAW